MKKVLKALAIIQIVSNEERHKNGFKRLGRGYSEAYRFNPYNPLSYIFLILMLVVGVFMFGFVGIWKETTTRNPFYWD